jgi:hypothetical protein
VPDLLLGRLVEVHTLSDAYGIEVWPVDGRFLSWDPARRRLHSVRLGRRKRGRPSSDALDLVEMFHWQNGGADEVDTFRPEGRRRARQIGELYGIVYRCAKEGKTLDYQHDFTHRPAASWDGSEWYFSGAVDVDERGIVS